MKETENRTQKKVITGEDILHVVQLARIDMEENELEKYTQEMERILGYVNKLQELNTDGVDATFFTYPLFNVFREDEPRESMNPDEVLANAPHRQDNYFRMPPII